MPLLKNEWVEMGDPAPPRRRTHGGAGAGALALVKPLPPKAVGGRPGFTRARRPRLQSPPADRWAAIQDHALAPSLSPGATSPIRNSKEPKKSTTVKIAAAVYVRCRGSMSAIVLGPALRSIEANGRCRRFSPAAPLP